jgi:hypothetical protein
VKRRGLAFGIEDNTKLPGLQDTVGRALRVIAAALVVEDRNFFRRTLTKANTDLQLVLFSVTLSLKRLNLRQGKQIETFLFTNDNVVATAIHREAGLDADKTISTSLGRMRFYFKSADHAPAVQQLLVVTQLFHVKTAFVGEIALDQELAREIVIPGERTITASRATVLTYRVL